MFTFLCDGNTLTLIAHNTFNCTK